MDIIDKKKCVRYCIFFKGWWQLVAFIVHYIHLYELERHQLWRLKLYKETFYFYKIKIRVYTAVFYGVLQNLSCNLSPILNSIGDNEI